jgi:hypothetical protein
MILSVMASFLNMLKMYSSNKYKLIPALAAAAVIATNTSVNAAISIVGVNTNTNTNTNTDAAYGAFVSSTDLVNQGRTTFSSVTYSNNPSFGSTSTSGGPTMTGQSALRTTPAASPIRGVGAR